MKFNDLKELKVFLIKNLVNPQVGYNNCRICGNVIVCIDKMDTLFNPNDVSGFLTANVNKNEVLKAWSEWLNRNHNHRFEEALLEQ